MIDLPMNRKEFLASSAKLCAGTCFCAIVGGLSELKADDKSDAPSGDAPDTVKPRAEKRIEFAEKWLVRFMDILGENLDEATFAKIMEENGRRCFSAWIDETGQEVQKATLSQFTDWVKENITDETFRVEGNIIHFRFTSAAETGEAAEAGQCLCSFAERQPKGLTGRYCHCSVGYVKEWFSRKFGRPVEVELESSVLRGDNWCQFRITVPA